MYTHIVDHSKSQIRSQNSIMSSARFEPQTIRSRAQCVTASPPKQPKVECVLPPNAGSLNRADDGGSYNCKHKDRMVCN